MTNDIGYAGLDKAAQIIKSGQSRSILLTGNIDDLYYDAQANGGKGDYVPLIDKLVRQWSFKTRVIVTYQLNGPILFQSKEDKAKMLKAWVRYRCADIVLGHSSTWRDPEKIGRPEAAAAQFREGLEKAQEHSTYAFEFLRQLCICSREAKEPVSGDLSMPENLLIVVEGADMHLPETEVSRMTDMQIRRSSICHDWFSDPAFQRSGDVVVLLAESRGSVNNRVARLPQVLGAELSAPDEDQRRHCISWFNADRPNGAPKVSMTGTADLAKWTAGLSIHALMQLLRGAAYQADGKVSSDAVIAMVEAYIKAQLGDDVVEFKRPAHRFDALKGNTKLKAYLNDEVMPRCASLDEDVISSILVSGPIGGGKTFIMEALAASLDMPVMELKNIRSQWFGQTDVIIDRLRRVLGSLSRVCIFIDEADSQFGDISTEQHSTEKRVSGAILRLMSDPRFKGRILWLLMTARPHLLPPDMKREGRGGNLVIPILDPSTEEDKRDFLKWVFLPVLAEGTDEGLLLDQLSSLEPLQVRLKTYSADSYRLLRSELKARSLKLKRRLDMKEVIAVVEDLIPPDVAKTRRYQTLQALMNCTRRSLLPLIEGDFEMARSDWTREIKALEFEGIR